MKSLVAPARAFSFFPSLVSVVVFQCLISLCLKQVFIASSFRVSIPYQPVIRVRGLSGSPPLIYYKSSACHIDFVAISCEVGRCESKK